jgi:predicted amidohydrolase
MTIEESEAVPDGDTVREVSSIARENKVWISGGSIHERADEVEEGKVWNTGFVVDDMGEFRGKYR